MLTSTVGVFVRRLFGLGESAQIHGLGIPARERRLRHRVIAIITWVMSAGFSVSLLGTVGLAVAGREIPEVLPQLLFATLGYFGGALASFMSSEVPRQGSS